MKIFVFVFLGLEMLITFFKKKTYGNYKIVLLFFLCTSCFPASLLLC